MFQNDTIAAIATGLTDSGIGIIRISGEKAISVGNKMFCSPSGKFSLLSSESHVLQYGFAVDNIGERKSDDWKDYIIDEVMAVVMKAPRSYTGEDTVEIHCHGGVLVMRTILDLSIKCGARLAEPGEFTKRAFLNGRIDLSRAEAVMDLIYSQNEYALASSVRQLGGRLAETVKDLRGEIIYEIAFIESALDDPEYVSLDGYPERLSVKVEMLQKSIRKLIDTAKSGRLIKEGISTVIVGKPNVGKSSFLNLLLGEERAIVTDIAGTTRDILQENIRLRGISLNMIDTAGIRETVDTVEKIGVDRTKQYMKDADLVVYVADSSVPLDQNDDEIMSLLRDKAVVALLNKSDLETIVSEEEFEEYIAKFFPGKKEIAIVKTSVKNDVGMEQFEDIVKNMFFGGDILSHREIVVTNMRHKEALQNAYNSLALVRKSIEDGMQEDFYSIDLMSAYAELGKIIGDQVEDDLVEEIFSKFCVGK